MMEIKDKLCQMDSAIVCLKWGELQDDEEWPSDQAKIHEVHYGVWTETSFTSHSLSSKEDHS